MFPDNATGRKILSLVIKCPNEGCSWTGEIRDKEVKTKTVINYIQSTMSSVKSSQLVWNMRLKLIKVSFPSRMDLISFRTPIAP